MKPKIESIGTTSGGLDVLKVIVPAATNEDIDSGALCVATLPNEFQGALLLYEQNGSWGFVTGEREIGFPLELTETERYIVKLAGFKKSEKKQFAQILKRHVGGSVASDA